MALTKTFKLDIEKGWGVPDKLISEFVTQCEAEMGSDGKRAIVRVSTLITQLPPGIAPNYNKEIPLTLITVIVTKLDDAEESFPPDALGYHKS